ncbi:MAG: radical SAM protein [Candidatus Omnitrophota bacterium]
MKPNPKAFPLPELSPKEFWDSAFKKAQASRALFEATLELTHGCNLRCVHCYHPTHVAGRGEMIKERITSLFKELREEGCFLLSLTGGEIFLRRDFFDLLKEAKEEGFAVILKTNGTLLTESTVEQLQSLLPLEIELSLYGATEKTYEKVTCVPGSFSRCISGIERLVQRKIPLTLILPAMTLNVDEIEKMRAMARRWGVRAVCMSLIHPKADGSLEPLAYRLDPERAIQILKEPFLLSEHKPVGKETRRRWKGRMHCQAAQSSCFITAYGEMNFCAAFPFPKYNLLEGSIREGWRTLCGWFDAHAKEEAADGNDPHPLYRGCPRDGWWEGDGLDAAVPYYEALVLAEERLENTAP